MNLEQRERILQIARDNNIDLADDSNLTYEDSEGRVIEQWEERMNAYRKAIEAVKGDAHVQTKGENEMTHKELQNALKQGKPPAQVKAVSPSEKVDPSIQKTEATSEPKKKGKKK